MWNNIPKYDKNVHKRNGSTSGSRPQITRSDMPNKYECLTDQCVNSEPGQPEQGAKFSRLTSLVNSPIDSENVSEQYTIPAEQKINPNKHGKE